MVLFISAANDGEKHRYFNAKKLHIRILSLVQKNIIILLFSCQKIKRNARYSLTDLRQQGDFKWLCCYDIAKASFYVLLHSTPVSHNEECGSRNYNKHELLVESIIVPHQEKKIFLNMRKTKPQINFPGC